MIFDRKLEIKEEKSSSLFLHQTQCSVSSQPAITSSRDHLFTMVSFVRHLKGYATLLQCPKHPYTIHFSMETQFVVSQNGLSLSIVLRCEVCKLRVRLNSRGVDLLIPYTTQCAHHPKLALEIWKWNDLNNELMPSQNVLDIKWNSTEQSKRRKESKH